MAEQKLKCASWCGRGCTHAEYQRAKTNSRRLAGKLGKGWKPQVWENLGWHWRVVNRGLKVHPSMIRGEYIAFLGDPDSPGGRWAEHGSTPKEAVRNVAAKAIQERDTISKTINGIADLL